jgi:hypothetical protein
MDSYLHSFLQQNPDFPLKDKLQHFRIQYLLKVASIDPEEAILFGWDISPWDATQRGAYHRSYLNSNAILSAIEREIARISGLQDFILINDQKLLEECVPFVTEIQGQRILSTPPILEKESLHSFFARTGHTPSLQNAAAMAARLNLEMPNDLTHMENGEGASFEQLLPVIQQFRNYSFSASVVSDLLEGFSFLKETPFLRDSYKRVLDFLNEAMQIPLSNYFNLPKFENYLELIYEEMILWLTLTEPYSHGELEKRIQECIHPAPFLRTVQTGMAAFSEVASVLITPDSNLFYFDDTYYENIPSFKRAKAYPISHPHYEPPLHGEKVDLLFADFHTNFLPGKMRTENHDLKAILFKILTSASPTFTLVIDNTIGFLKSAEIGDLLKTFPHLNIVVLWSHQKFDLFGTDKVSGGSYCVYSKDEELLSRFRALKGGEIDTVSRQVLTHFFTFGAKKLEERRRKIFANACYVNQRIDNPLVVKKADAQCFSLDVQMEKIDEKFILKEFWRRGVPLMTRYSFGFNITSQSCIHNVIRFSIGIEEEKHLDLFIKAFNDIFHNNLHSLWPSAFSASLR